MGESHNSRINSKRDQLNEVLLQGHLKEIFGSLLPALGLLIENVKGPAPETPPR